MDEWKSKLLKYVVSMLLGLLSPELLKKFADYVLDFIEEVVLKSPTKVDDELLLPLCQIIRLAFGIEDNDVTPPA